MADEYIRRVEAEEAIEEYCCRMCADYNQYEGGCVSHAQHCPHLSGEEILKPVESVDVQPIVYAHKTINVGRRSYCSNCGKLAIMEDFCSKCGAKVKDGDTNG